MLQDLNDIAVLGKENTEPLTKINFDLTLLDKAAESADQYSSLLAEATSDRLNNSEAKILRDKAYALLKASVDEIRDCGQYVFWQDEIRLKGYVSQYFKRRNQARRNKQSETTEE